MSRQAAMAAQTDQYLADLAAKRASGAPGMDTAVVLAALEAIPLRTEFPADAVTAGRVLVSASVHVSGVIDVLRQEGVPVEDHALIVLWVLGLAGEQLCREGAGS